MDSNGRLYDLGNREDKARARKRSDLIPVPDSQVRNVKTMNRQQRRAWYSDQRRQQRQNARRP